MTLEGLVNETGVLAKTFSKLDPATIQHASEITNDRRTLEDKEERQKLRNNWFWTADSSLYTVEDGDAILYFGNRGTNLIFKNIEEATTQLLKDNNYVPSREDIKSVKTGNTLRINLSELELKGDNDEWRYFDINTSDYDSLNSTQRTFAESVYGQGDDFIKNMEMIDKAGKSTTRVYVLNSDYVKDHVERDGAIARASGLGIFGDVSGFYGEGRNVDSASGALRGVPLVGEADTQKINEFYSLLKNNPTAIKLAKDMLTKGTASIMLDIGSSHFTNSK